MVYANLDSENKTVRANALEVIDNILGKDESRLLLTLLEDQPIAKKIEYGSEVFPIERKSPERWIELLLHDPNPWVVVCTLHLIGEQKIAELRSNVTHHLTSSDAIVRETAGRTLAQLVSAKLEASDLSSPAPG